MRGRFRGDREEICRRHVTPPPTRVEDVCLATPFSPHENDETGKGVTKSGRPLKDAQKTSKKTHTHRDRERKRSRTARRRKRRRRRRDQRERSLAKRDEEERNRESERPKSDDDDDDDDDERYISHSFVASVFFFRYN